MSTKISGFVVVFDHSVSEEYMDRIKAAVQLFDGVVKVDAIPEDLSLFSGAIQEKHRITDALFTLLKNDYKLVVDSK